MVKGIYLTCAWPISYENTVSLLASSRVCASPQGAIRYTALSTVFVRVCVCVCICVCV